MKVVNIKIQHVAIIIGALGGLAAILGYFDAKKHRKIQQDNLKVEKDLAELKLMLAKQEAIQKGVALK